MCSRVMGNVWCTICGVACNCCLCLIAFDYQYAGREEHHIVHHIATPPILIPLPDPSSQAYQESANCRTEATYAYTRHIDYVPLLIETNFRASGWLGAMLGMRLYIDFTDETRFDLAILQVRKPQGVILRP